MGDECPERTDDVCRDGVDRMVTCPRQVAVGAVGFQIAETRDLSRESPRGSRDDQSSEQDHGAAQPDWLSRRSLWKQIDKDDDAHPDQNIGEEVGPRFAIAGD